LIECTRHGWDPRLGADFHNTGPRRGFVNEGTTFFF
jgi:hypothetical protein